MSIYDEVSNLIKEAMRAKDKQRLSALRNIRASFIAALKEDGSDSLSDKAAIAILRRLAKQRLESIAAYESGGRDDLVANEQAELVVIDAFLPRLADEETTRTWVSEAIAASGASSARDIGKVMGALMRAHKGDIDGKLAKRLVSEALG